jgi:hypothetical protein
MNQAATISHGRLTTRSLALLVALACCAAVLMTRAPGVHAASTIEYPTFTSVTGLTLNGDASQQGTALRLTPAELDTSGTAFSDTEIQTTTSFETEFELLMHESNTTGGLGPADGMGFVLEPGSAQAVGEPGGDLGFAGIKPSADIEYDIFDDYFYSPPDPATPYVSFMENGSVLEHLAESETPLKFELYGAPVWSWVDYDAATHVLSVYASPADTKPATPLFQYTVDLAELLGSEYTYAGFTAATGSGDAAQEVLSWNLTTSGTAKSEPVVPPTKPGEPAPHGSATQVICNLIVATSSDTCTATVSDVDVPAAIVPTGQVTFTSASGGVFSAGDTCNLVATPGSPNTASCSVQFLPPSSASTGPAITASYGGDSHHSASKGQTFYPPASELAKDVDIEEIGNVKDGGTVDTSVNCGFPCEASGELLSGSGGTSARVTDAVAILAKTGAKGGGKRHLSKPVVLGKGTLRLTAPGRGVLALKLSAKGRKALKRLTSKGVRATLVVTIRTLNGTVVATEHKSIKLRPAPKAHKSKGKQGKSK